MKQWKFWQHRGLLQKYVNRGIKIERLKLINDKLLARSERFKTACCSLEKQKENLTIRALKAEELASDRWGPCEEDNKELENQVTNMKGSLAACDIMIKRQEKVIERQRAEILRLIENETFGVKATR